MRGHALFAGSHELEGPHPLVQRELIGLHDAAHGDGEWLAAGVTPVDAFTMGFAGHGGNVFDAATERASSALVLCHPWYALTL